MEYLSVSCPESQLLQSLWKREIHADEVTMLSIFMSDSQPHLAIEIQQRTIPGASRDVDCDGGGGDSGNLAGLPAASTLGGLLP